MRIIESLLRRPLGTMMLCLGLSLGGIWAGFNMRIDFLPDFSVPKLTVIAACQGLPADEIRTLITIPLENSISSIGGLKKMKSLSRDGLALIELEFPWGTDRSMAGIQCREVIDTAYLSLPAEAPKPQVLDADPGDMPIITLAVYPKTGNLSQARRLAGRELCSRLQRIEGVGSIQVSGGTEEEIHIDVDPKLLAGRGYSLPELSRILEASNIDYPAGSLTEGNTEYLVKTKARTESLPAFANLYLPSTNESSPGMVQLKDVADLKYGIRKQTSFFYGWSEEREGEEGIRLIIRRQSGFSPREMAKNVTNELEEIKRCFGRDLEITLLSDRSKALDRSLRDLLVSLIIGSIIAFLILLLFMRNIPQSLILLFSLPSSLLWTLLLLSLCGKSLNLMSLGGLALGVGMVVDNSIVITERLARTVISGKNREERIKSIAEAAGALSPSLIGSTATTVIVFTPLLMVRGLAGSIFGDLGLSVIFALSSSLILSLTAVPVLYLLLNPSVKKRNSQHSWGLFLRKVLRLSLRHSAAVIIIITILGASGLTLTAFLPKEVIPPLNEGRLSCCVQMPPGTSLQAVRSLAVSLTENISEITGIKEIHSWAGGEQGDAYYLCSTDEAAEIIQLRLFYPLKADRNLLIKQLKKRIKPVGCFLTILPEENILENLLGFKSGQDWVVKGDKPGEVRRKAVAILGELIKTPIPGGQPNILPSAEKTLIRLYPDRQALSASEIDLPLLSGQIRDTLYGSIATRIINEGREIKVRVQVREEDRGTKSDIMNLMLPGGSTGLMRIGSLVTLREETALPFLLREDRKDLSLIHFPGKPGPDSAAILSEAGAVPYESPVLQQQAGELSTLFILALLLLYLCLGIQFESFSVPVLLMLSIPLGAAGIGAALAVSSGSINLNSSLAILVIMGVSVNNGILLYEESRTLFNKEGARPEGAIYRGTSSRLRPIVMTSLTTITALLPLAIDPRGTSSQASLAAAVIGGLCTSTALSLLLLPGILLVRLKGDKKKSDVS